MLPFPHGAEPRAGPKPIQMPPINPCNAGISQPGVAIDGEQEEMSSEKKLKGRYTL